MQDVEGLQGVEPPVPLVLREDGVVRPVVPLQDDITGANMTIHGQTAGIQGIKEPLKDSSLFSYVHGC